MASEDSTLNHRQRVLALLASCVHGEREPGELDKSAWLEVLLRTHSQNDLAEHQVVLQFA